METWKSWGSWNLIKENRTVGLKNVHSYLSFRERNWFPKHEGKETEQLMIINPPDVKYQMN